MEWSCFIWKGGFYEARLASFGIKATCRRLSEAQIKSNTIITCDSEKTSQANEMSDFTSEQSERLHKQVFWSLVKMWRKPLVLSEELLLHKSVKRRLASSLTIFLQKKMVDHFYLIRKILPSSNGCKLMNYGHRFVNLRKYLCFYLEKNFLLKQKDFFSETNAKCSEK